MSQLIYREPRNSIWKISIVSKKTKAGLKQFDHQDPPIVMAYTFSREFDIFETQCDFLTESQMNSS